LVDDSDGLVHGPGCGQGLGEPAMPMLVSRGQAKR
jgi:hypothetical protein